MTNQMSSAEDAYDRFRQAVKRRAAELKKPLEVSQAALWAKNIATEAFAGKYEDHFTFRAEDGRFGFSEMLVNQCIEFGMRYSADADDRRNREAYMRGYEDARREFAKATGLYTEDDFND
jgi:hypothetical protein